MVRFTQWDVDNHERKIAKPLAKVFMEEQHVSDESQLHLDIIKWCDGQWPKWKYVHARMDRPSTLDLGVADFTMFCTLLG